MSPWARMAVVIGLCTAVMAAGCSRESRETPTVTRVPGAEVDAPPPSTSGPSLPRSPAAPSTAVDEDARLIPLAFSQLPDWEAGFQGYALEPMQRSCAKFETLPPSRELGGSLLPQATIGDMRQPCQAARQIGPEDHGAARRFFETYFMPFQVTAGGQNIGLFTGYYEAELHGSWHPSAHYTVPIYGRPRDLVQVDLRRFNSALSGERIVGKVEDGKLIPYDDRGAIEAGSLQGRAQPLLWVNDPTEAFFLHVQGSGRVIMTDGSIVHIGYAAKNGYPYQSIGRELVRRGEMTLAEASKDRIKQWVEAHPRQAADLFAHNRSYIFFELRENGAAGPIGAQGVPLTARRSLAVDRQYLPLGLPLWLDVPYRGAPQDRIRQLVLAQDTGSAIKGPVRGDFFWGSGPEAGRYAGRMKSRGSYFLLVPRSTASRLMAMN